MQENWEGNDRIVEAPTPMLILSDEAGSPSAAPANTYDPAQSFASHGVFLQQDVGAYAQDKLILLADSELSTALSQTGSRAELILDLQAARQESEFIPLLIQVHDNTESIALFLDNLELLSQHSWIDLSKDAYTRTQNVGTLELPEEHPVSDIPESILDLRTSRRAIGGLHYALGLHSGADADQEPLFSPDEMAELEQDYRSSLALFAGPGAVTREMSGELEILPAPPELSALSAELRSYVDEQFSGLEIHADSVVFSGSRGSLPISIRNDSGQSFFLDVHYFTPEQNIIIYPEYSHEQFPPGESFLEPSVELRNIVSGSVSIELWAGDHPIAAESVRISATYADRIAIIVIVILAGTGLAFFVWKRTQSSEHNAKQRSSDAHDKAV
jgi:hypothetical protein